MNLEQLRREYSQAGMDRNDLAEDPVEQFRRWFEQAARAGIVEPNAMALATVGADGRPSQRTVLLKSFDEHGLVFFTNYESRKARDIAVHAEVALMFAWIGLERQVTIEGSAGQTETALSEKYFAGRPYGSQLGAWVSAQSSVVTTRGELESKLAEYEKKFPKGKVPLPPYWGGYRVKPRAWEFWQGRANRLHDRFRYTWSEGGWVIERLAP